MHSCESEIVAANVLILVIVFPFVQPLKVITVELRVQYSTGVHG